MANHWETSGRDEGQQSLCPTGKVANDAPPPELPREGSGEQCSEWQDEAEMSSFQRWVAAAYGHCVFIMFIVTVVALVMFSVWLVISLHAQHVQAHDIGLLISGLFVLTGLPVNIWLIVMHLHNYTLPPLQKLLIRILWMVPIYAISSWLAMYFTKQAIYFNTLRSCYEAFVVYSFHLYLMLSLEGMHGSKEEMLKVLEDKEDVCHPVPFCWLADVKMGEPFLQMTRRGVLVYVVVRLATALVALPLEIVGWYGDGVMDFSNGFVYLSIVNNGAAIWGLYCLITFFQVLKKELAPIAPWAKFLCVKLVVFFSYWQGLLLSLLASFGMLPGGTWNRDHFTSKDVQNNLQNFIICIEMLFFALAHHWAFSYQPYVQGSDCAAMRRPWYHMLWVMDFDELAQDVKEQAPYLRGKVSENTRLLKDVASQGKAAASKVRWNAQRQLCGMGGDDAEEGEEEGHEAVGWAEDDRAEDQDMPHEESATGYGSHEH